MTKLQFLEMFLWKVLWTILQNILLIIHNHLNKNIFPEGECKIEGRQTVEILSPLGGGGKVNSKSEKSLQNKLDIITVVRFCRSGLAMSDVRVFVWGTGTRNGCLYAPFECHVFSLSDACQYKKKLWKESSTEIENNKDWL